MIAPTSMTYREKVALSPILPLEAFACPDCGGSLAQDADWLVRCDRCALFFSQPKFISDALPIAPAVDETELDRLREALVDCVAILSGELTGKSQVKGVIREARAALNHEGKAA